MKFDPYRVSLAVIWLVAYATVSEPVLAQSIGGVGESSGAGAIHAMKQVGALMLLLFALSFLGGLSMVVASIKKWMNSEPNERETMSVGKLMFGVVIGVSAMLLPLVIALGHNTMWGAEPITSQELQSFAIDGNLAQQSALSIREGPGKYIPAGALIAFYGILIFIGSISIYMGLRDAWIAIMYGNDMYGTSMPFKTPKVLGHFIFGFGLIFINKTQCLLVSTFSSSSLCW